MTEDKGGAGSEQDVPQAFAPAAIASKLRDAIALHQQGQIPQAEVLYREILRLDPRQFDALHMLGLAALQSGDTETGIDLVGRAIQIDPRQAAAHVNLGNAMRLLRRPEEALASYDRALQLASDSVDVLYNRANVLLELKRPDQALASAERALQLGPGHAGVLNLRGRALRDLKRPEDAIASYDRALELEPDFALALYNRGNALLEVRRLEEALASYDRASHVKPGDADILTNRGNALLELGRLEEALDSYDRALALNPDLALALNNRATTLNELKRPEASVSGLVRLLQVAPDYDYALGSLLYTKLCSGNWSGFAEDADKVMSSVLAGRRTCMPFPFLALGDDPQAQLQCARTFINDRYPPSASPLAAGRRYQHEKIRVAYLSADFHDHATAYLMAELFERHDAQHFETMAVSLGPDSEDAMRARLRRSFHKFLEVRTKSDLETARSLRDLEIDIAVDLKGFTADCRTGILAYRAAPIQVNYLGYPGTMGADYIDYIIADRYIIPEEQQGNYSEKVVYLPDCYQVNDSERRIAAHTPTRADIQLPERGFVFCCFNNPFKITPDVFDIWMRLLRKVEGSVLWLIEGAAVVSRNLREAAVQRDIAPERLVFAPRMELDRHLARHRLADLFLDTLPVNAHTTTSDALWAGLPVLTRIGNTFAARVAASLLHAVDLPELITHSAQEYEALALKLATTPEMLAAIRAKLTRNPSAQPLFDADRFRRHIESAFTTMWERAQRGEPPASFAVPSMS